MSTNDVKIQKDEMLVGSYSAAWAETDLESAELGF